MYTCAKCASKQLVCQRVDSDWHSNPATQVNDDSCYDADNLRALARSRVQCSVSATICLDCGHEGLPWDDDGAAPPDTLVPVKLGNGKIKLAERCSRLGVWFDDIGRCLPDVVAWRAL